MFVRKSRKKILENQNQKQKQNQNQNQNQENIISKKQKQNQNQDQEENQEGIVEDVTEIIKYNMVVRDKIHYTKK